MSIKVIDFKEDENAFYGKKHTIKVKLSPPYQEVFYDGNKVASGEFSDIARSVFSVGEKEKTDFYEVIVVNWSGEKASIGLRLPRNLLQKRQGLLGYIKIDGHYVEDLRAMVVRNGEIIYNEGVFVRPRHLDELKMELKVLAQQSDIAKGTIKVEEPASSGDLTSVCPLCGVRSRLPVAGFCWNCGAALQAPSDATENQAVEKTGVQISKTKGRSIVTPRILHGARRGNAARPGKCMVCDLEIKKSDEVMWCPYCGNAAHKNHLLEWFHVKKTCPICQHLMDEREILNEAQSSS